jgi:hypothetical protein
MAGSHRSAKPKERNDGSSDCNSGSCVHVADPVFPDVINA